MFPIMGCFVHRETQGFICTSQVGVPAPAWHLSPVFPCHHIGERSSAGLVHTRNTDRPIGARLGCCRLILMSTSPCVSAEIVEAPSPTCAPRVACGRCWRSRRRRL